MDRSRSGFLLTPPPEPDYHFREHTEVDSDRNKHPEAGLRKDHEADGLRESPGTCPISPVGFATHSNLEPLTPPHGIDNTLRNVDAGLLYPRDLSSLNVGSSSSDHQASSRPWNAGSDPSRNTDGGFVNFCPPASLGNTSILVDKTDAPWGVVTVAQSSVRLEPDAVTLVASKSSKTEGIPKSDSSDNLQSSQFSLTDLPDTDPVRRVQAAKVRTQARAIPGPGDMPSGNRSFPHYFGNRERLPLNNEPPLIEHPLTPDKPYERDSNPGSARIITNWWDRSTPEVVYHDPLTPPLPGATYPPFKMANYRPASRDGVEGSEAAAPNDELGRTGLATPRRSTSL